jgi:hypothetical protein
MLVMLGDTVTLVKQDTWITGQVAGVVLNDKRELERVYIHNINVPFYLSDGWRIVDDEEEGEELDG